MNKPVLDRVDMDNRSACIILSSMKPLLRKLASPGLKFLNRMLIAPGIHIQSNNTHKTTLHIVRSVKDTAMIQFKYVLFINEKANIY